MNFIVFNTLAKALHYIKYKSLEVNENCYEDNYSTHIDIRGNLVVIITEGIEYCGASDPEEGYVCCSDYFCDVEVIGRIKNFKINSHEKA